MKKTLTKFKLHYRGLLLVTVIGLVAVVGYVWKTNTTHAQACSGCRNASLTVTGMPNGADTFTVVNGTFAGGFYKSGTVCYPRQFQSGTMTYRVLSILGAQVYPASGYATLPDAMNQVHAGTSYDAGATPCTGVTTNMYTYEFISTIPMSKVANGQYFIEIEATSVYSGNTSTAFQDTTANVVMPGTTVDHSGYTGQLILSGVMGSSGDTTIVQNDTASWNVTLSCTNYNGKVNVDFYQNFTGVTLQWYSGNTLVGTGSTFYNRTCGEALTLKMVTGPSTSPLASSQPVEVCLSSPGNVAMPNCGGEPHFTIVGQPKITSFTASSKAVVPGGSTNLSWTTQNVTSATTGCAQSVSSGSATGWSSNTAPSSGSNVSVTINTVPTVLTLTCSSPNGTTAASASITITSLGDFNFNTAPTAFTNVGGSVSQTFTLNCTSPFAGPLTNVNMQSTLSGVTSYRITDLTSGLTGALNTALATASCGDVMRLDIVLSSNALPISWGSNVTPVTVNLVGTAASVGTKIGGGFNLTIYPNPTVTLTPTAVAGAVGSSPTLTWTSTFANSCNATNGSSGWAGSKNVNGNQTLSAINTATTYTYTLTCYNYVYPTAVNASYTTSSAKIQVEIKYDGTLYSYPSGAPQRSVYYYIIDRTDGTVILPQAMHDQPLQITSVIPGHQYQLMYRSGWLGTADYGGTAGLYKKATPFITDTNGNDLSAAQTIADGQTLTFRLNWQNVGNVSSPLGQGCPNYYYVSNRYANMDLWYRLSPSGNYPAGVTVNGPIYGDGQLIADEPTYYTPSPSANFFSSFGNQLVSADWKATGVNLRESPGWYYYWMVSTTMSGYCSTISMRVLVDAPATPTYGFTATPVNLSFSAQQNGSVPASKDVNITGTGNQNTPVNASGAASWLTVNPTSMTLNSYTQYMHFQPNTTNLPIGTYNSVVRVMDTQGNYYDITITYTINANSANCPNGPQVQLSSRYVNVGSTVTASAPIPGVTLLSSSYNTVDSYAGYTALADLNGDGWLDMVVANNNVGSISVFLNQGDGTFGPHTEYNLGLYTGVIRVADFNGDGKPDLAVSTTDTSYYSRTSIIINNGSGAFGVQTDYYSMPTNAFFPGGVKAYQQGLVVADFNGDGKADIMYASNPLVSYSNGIDGSIRTLVVRLGNGNGTFGAEQITTTNLTGQDTASSYATLADDFNGDGKQDVVLINNASNSFWVFNGLGTGKFGTGTVYSTGGSMSIASADLNNDSKPDLVTADMGYSSGGGAQNNGTTATVYLNNGNGTFTNSGSYTTASQPRSVALGDINGDGKVDIAVLNNYYSSNNVTVLLGDGLGGFGFASNFSNSPGWNGQNLQLGDIDNDGKLDVITVNSGNIEFFKNTSSVPPIPVGASYSGGTYTISNSALASIAGTTVTALDGRPNSGIVYVSASNLSYNTGSYFASGCTLNPTPLYIRDFNIYSTGNKSVLQGITANLGFNVVSINGFTGSVALSTSGAPSTPGPVTMSPTGPFSSFPNTTTVTVPTSAGTAGGDYTVRAIGTYNGISRVGNANLNVTTPQVADIKASKDGTNGSYVDGPLTIGYNVAPYISWTTSGVSTCSVTGPGLNSSALTNSGIQVSNLTTNQTYTISCDGGTVTDTVSVVVYNNVPTMQSVTNATDGTTPCGQVKITWSANGAASSYKVYRNINNSTSDGGLVSVITGITNTYYLYTNPPAGPYYYFVTAVDSNGNESNYTATSNNKGAALSCTVDLSTSDIEISSVNGTANNNPSAADCDRSTAPIATAPGLLRKGNKIVFKVNICNSGGVDFVPSVGSPLQITSTLANLTFSASDPITYNCGGCTGSYQVTPGTGTTPDSVVFTINNGTLPKQSSSNPSVWSVTFTATTRSPSTSSATIFRFNNRADITAGAYHNSYSTPYYFFYFNQANPVIKEVGH